MVITIILKYVNDNIGLENKVISFFLWFSNGKKWNDFCQPNTTITKIITFLGSMHVFIIFSRRRFEKQAETGKAQHEQYQSYWEFHQPSWLWTGSRLHKPSRWRYDKVCTKSSLFDVSRLFSDSFFLHDFIGTVTNHTEVTKTVLSKTKVTKGAWTRWTMARRKKTRAKRIWIKKVCITGWGSKFAMTKCRTTGISKFQHCEYWNKETSFIRLFYFIYFRNFFIF